MSKNSPIMLAKSSDSINYYSRILLGLFVFSQILLKDTLLFSVPTPILESVSQSIVYSIIAFSLAMILFRKYKFSKKLLFLFGFSTFALYLSYIRCVDSSLVLPWLVIIAISGTKLDALFRTYLRASVAAVAMAVVLSVINVIYNKSTFPNDRLVFSYGFGHPNTLAALLISIAMAMTYVYWENRKWVMSTIAALVFAAFSKVALSSSAGMSVCVLIALINGVGHLIHVPSKESRAWKRAIKALAFMPIVLLLFMMLVAAYYEPGNPIVTFFDKATHARLTHAHSYYVSHDGFTLYGRRFDSPSSFLSGLPFASLDSGYCYLPLVFGLIATVVVVMLYVRTAKALMKNPHPMLVWGLVLVGTLYCVVESYPLYLRYSCLPLLLTAGIGDGKGTQSHDNSSPDNSLGALFGVAALGIALLLGTIYHFRYTVVDTSSLAGHVRIIDAEDLHFEMDVDSSLNCAIDYRDKSIAGRLEVASAQPESVVYKLVNTDESSSDVAFYIEMPRSGLQGNKVGLWRLYYNDFSTGEVVSDYLLLGENGECKTALGLNSNSLTQSERLLYNNSVDCRWSIVEPNQTIQIG